MKDDAVSPATLELLQIRELALKDRVQEMLEFYDSTRNEHELHTDEDESSEQHMTTPIQDDSVSDLILEIADCEARRARSPERPEWFGPIEQLQLVAAGSSEPLLDVADELLGEVESHGTKHFYPCRCYDLQEPLSDRIQPILQEYADLSRDIKKLKRHVRFGANVSNPTARSGGDGLSGTEIEQDR